MQSNDTLLPEEYLPLLDELNRIVSNSAERAEGNLFYYHKEPSPRRASVYAPFYLKRRNFALTAQASTRLLEVGMNAGHSALLALAHGVEYHGVDIAKYSYVKPAAAFLKNEFGDRFHFYEGDSLKVLPQMAADYPALRFDMIHIDGHHGVYYFRHDTQNALAMAMKDAWVIVDDTDMKDIQQFFQEELESGTLVAGEPKGWEFCKRHAIARAG